MKNRKDTIMVAVLVNAAILAVLFVSAVKYREDKPSFSLENPEKIVQSLKLEQQPLAPPLSPQNPPHSILISADKSEQGEASPSLTTGQDIGEGGLDFVKELEAIARGSTQSQTALFTPGVQTAGETLVSQREIGPSAGYIEVKVKKGDALAKIAKTHQTTVEEIMSYNQLKTTLLNVGQVLKIPGKVNSSTQASYVRAPSESATEGQEAKFYTVKAGDNPWSIAAKHQIKVDQLLKLNQLTPEKARHLKPGDKLRIR